MSTSIGQWDTKQKRRKMGIGILWKILMYYEDKHLRVLTHNDIDKLFKASTALPMTSSSQNRFVRNWKSRCR